MYTIETKKRKNSKKYTPIEYLDTVQGVKDYLTKNNIQALEKTPYFFTHINLSNGNILACSINGIYCSPTTLHKELIQS